MNIEQLITSVRTDYLDDSIQGDLWDDDFMFRAFTEAERQACNRQALLFDESIGISLIAGLTSFDIPQKVNKIEYVALNDVEIKRQSKQEVERSNPSWRTLKGVTGKSLQYIIRGHKLRVVPSPDASVDSTFVQDSEPLSGMNTDDTWFDTVNNLLHRYDGVAWVIDASAALGSLYVEAFRLPNDPITSIASVLEIPEEYHRDLIYWVLHEAYKKQDSDTFQQERSDYFLNRFTGVFGEYISAEVRLNQMQQRRSMHLRPTAYTTKLTSSTSNDDWDNI